MGCRLRDAGLVNAQLSELQLDPLAHDNLTHILGLNKAPLCPLSQLLLDLLQDSFIFKSCFPGIKVKMDQKRALLDKIQDPLADGAHLT